MSTFFLGQVVPFAGNFAPRGWMLCQGQLIPISQNTALFSLLGTNFGGNGTTTFALPDLRGAVAVSPGQGPGRSPYDVGETGGTESVTMTMETMPAHVHAVNLSVAVKGNDGTADVASTKVLKVLAAPTEPIYTSASDGSTMKSGAATASLTVGPVGTSLPIPTVMPYLAVNYCICVEGVFPQRP
jgi:microcystin-dependent protein